MHVYKLVIIGALQLAALPLAQAAATVDAVDLQRYQGLWYEIARIPNAFQDNTPDDFGVCHNTTARYGILPNGRVSVLNSCERFNESGELAVDDAEGVAKVVADSNNSKLKVNFTGIGILQCLGIGDGDYWIYGLGPANENGEYAWSLVGDPDFNTGWILSRSANLSEPDYAAILDLARTKGFDPNEFKTFKRSDEAQR